MSKQTNHHKPTQPLDKILEGLPQLVWTTGPDGVPDYVSHQWQDYTGFGLQETIELGWGFSCRRMTGTVRPLPGKQR